MNLYAVNPYGSNMQCMYVYMYACMFYIYTSMSSDSECAGVCQLQVWEGKRPRAGPAPLFDHHSHIRVSQVCGIMLLMSCQCYFIE